MMHLTVLYTNRVQFSEAEVHMKRFLTTIFFLAILLAVNCAAASAPQSSFILGKEAWVTIAKDTMFDGALLKPGFYLVADRSSGATHGVTFWKAGDSNLALQYSDKAFDGDPIFQSSTVQAAPSMIRKTRIVTVSDGGVQRITQVEIKGENVIHVF